MPVSSKLIKIYSDISICSDKCSGVRNEPANGVIGRGFYCPYDPRGVSLMMISKNPGVSNIQEFELYKARSGTERVHCHENFAQAKFKGQNLPEYHENILDWVSIILDVEATHEAVFKKSALSALVKCESMGDKKKVLPTDTSGYCFHKHLLKEIRTIKPAYLLAFGKEAYTFLKKPHVKHLHNLPVEYLHHPSWTNMRGGVGKYKAEKLPILRKKYLKACNGTS